MFVSPNLPPSPRPLPNLVDLIPELRPRPSTPITPSAPPAISPATPAALAMTAKYRPYLNDPVGFAATVLHRTFTPSQITAAQSVLIPPYRTLIPSGNEQGKTLLSAALAIWWHCTRAPGIVITTAPRMDSVRDLLWKEIRTLATMSRLELDFLPRACRIERAPNDFVVGMTATDATSFQGHHGPNMLFILEEANGVPSQFWEAVETMFSPPGHAWVCIYNPTMTSGQDYVEYSRVQSAERRRVIVHNLDTENPDASNPDTSLHANPDSARLPESGAGNQDTSTVDNLDSVRVIDNRLSLATVGNSGSGGNSDIGGSNRAHAGGSAVQGDRAVPPWHVVRMSALDHPNIAAELRGQSPPVPHAMRLAKFERLLRSWSQLVAPNEKPRPTDVQWPPAWAEGYQQTTRQRPRWYRPGPIAEARLLGRYPSQGVNSVWSDGDWIAATREGMEPIAIPLYALPEIGCDVARYGDDFTAIHIRIHLCSVHAESANGWSTTETAGRLIQLADHYALWYNARMGELPQAKRRPSILGSDIPIKIEDDGVGGGVVDLVRERGYYAIPVKASANAWAVGEYPNRRSELWFTAAGMARVDEIDLSRLDPSRVDETGWPCSVEGDYLDELKRQLMAPTWVMDSRGRRVVERKEEMKARLGRSPDDADAFNIAYAPWSVGDGVPSVGASRMNPVGGEMDYDKSPRFQMGGVE